MKIVTPVGTVIKDDLTLVAVGNAGLWYSRDPDTPRGVTPDARRHGIASPGYVELDDADLAWYATQTPSARFMDAWRLRGSRFVPADPNDILVRHYPHIYGDLP